LVGPAKQIAWESRMGQLEETRKPDPALLAIVGDPAQGQARLRDNTGGGNSQTEKKRKKNSKQKEARSRMTTGNVSFFGGIKPKHTWEGEKKIVGRIRRKIQAPRGRRIVTLGTIIPH